MKNTKIMILLLSGCLSTMSIQAQSPTEAQKKAMMDAMKMSRNKGDVSDVPSHYAFSWKYNMHMTAASGKAVDFQYYLQPNASYYGARMDQGGTDMFMIMDTKTKTTVTSFNKKGQKMAMVNKMPDYSDTKMKNDKYTYKKLPNKVILGYNCKGIQATNSASTIVFYYTNDAKVSFTELFKSQQGKGLPDAFKDIFKPGEKPLLLSMDYTDLKDKSKSMKMHCTSLKKEAYTFNKSEYQFM